VTRNSGKEESNQEGCKEGRKGEEVMSKCEHERAAIGKATNNKTRGKALAKYSACKRGKKAE
jgi:hypothetical protein